MKRIFGLRPVWAASGARAPAAAYRRKSLRVGILRFRKLGRGHHAFGAKAEVAVLDEWRAALGEVCDHSLAPAAEVGGMGGVACEVVELVRVTLEIEELLLAVARMEDVLGAAVGEGVPVI